MQKVTVELAERSYDIVIGEGILSETGRYIKELNLLPNVFIITDKNVSRLHLKALKKALSVAGIKHKAIIRSPGERMKSFRVLESVLEEILKTKPERGVSLIALGGGVVGDLTGFAASILLRGVSFIQIPTSLLAMVDSSVGGKTAINSKHSKNMIGTFYQPKMVLADISLLSTLPTREFLAGYAEAVKYGLINRPEFFDRLDSFANLRDHVEEIVAESCKAKAEIVAQDERESGKRALLNLGHTFAHALEAETKFSKKLLHGEAVAIGMVLAFRLSVRLGLCPNTDYGRVVSHFKRVGLKTSLNDVKHPWKPKRLLNHMYGDKKVKDGKLVFILVRGIGKAFIAKDVEPKAVLDLLSETNES